MGNWDGSKPNNDGERELIDRAVKALEAELATKTCNKQIVSKLENAELARDSDVTCNNKQVTSKLVASEDAISRQAAIDAFSMFAEYESNRTNAEWVDRIRVVLSSLPPVTPKQRTGHWIEIAQYSDGIHKIECSECESHIFDRGHANSFNVKNKYKYCQKCGCRMVEPRESDHKCHTCKHYTSGENDGSCGSYICKEYSNWESEEQA